MPNNPQNIFYFGGSRHGFGSAGLHVLCIKVTQAAAVAGLVHVGCQTGVDAAVIQACPPSSLVVFAVSATKPAHVPLGAQCHTSAGQGGSTIAARFFLRSLAGLKGASAAVFFAPGPGSLRVASAAVRQNISVFAFGHYPAPIPASLGFWVESSFLGFQCWQWQTTYTQQTFL